MNVIETVLVIIAFITITLLAIFNIGLCVLALKDIVEDIVKDIEKGRNNE